MGRMLNKVLIQRDAQILKGVGKELPCENTSHQKIMKALAEAWNLYLEAMNYQATPQDSDDLNDFRKAIHDAQRIVATRELQLVKEEFFK